MKTYGYARCSTNETKQDIERQKRELKAMGAQHVYHEYESGTKANRPELTKLLDAMEPGSTLIVTEVSRITRSTKQLCEIIELAKEKRLKLTIGSFVVDCTGSDLDPMTDGMLKMLGVFAEMERSMTIDRIKSGLKNARAKGVRLGRPTLTIGGIPKKVVGNFDKYSSGDLRFFV